jgi:AAA15 family ATPase/GTPase
MKKVLELVDNKVFEYQLSAFRLENFMGFENSGWIELRPITLLFGHNSAGKSAVIRALLLLKQSMEAANSDTPLFFTGNFVDLGSYQNTVFGHKPNTDIGFSFRVSREPLPPPPNEPGPNSSIEEKEAYESNQKYYEDYRDYYFSKQIPWTKNDRGDIEDCQTEIRMVYGLLPEGRYPRLKLVEINGYRQANDSSRKQVNLLQLKYDTDEHTWLPTLDAKLTDLDSDNPFAQELWQRTNVELKRGILPSLKAVDQADLKRQDMPKGWDTVRSILDFFSEQLQGRFESLVYLPSLRDSARRYYFGANDWISALADDEGKPAKLVNRWLNDAFTNAVIQVRPLDEDEGIWSVILHNKPEKFESNIRDMGVGLGQAIPIIVRSAQLDKDGLVLVEQPELHLHPDAQVALVDLIIDFASSGRLFVIETHSEHFLLRLQRRIAESSVEKIYPDPVKARNDGHNMSHDHLAVQFITRDGIKSVVEHIYSDEAGRLYAGDSEYMAVEKSVREPSEKFKSFFRLDYEDARLLGRAMSEVLHRNNS